MNTAFRAFVIKTLSGLTLVILAACSTAPYEGSRLDLSQSKIGGVNDMTIALVQPMTATLPCKGDRVLVSLPDEVACEDSDGWIFKPSQLILPPADMLLVSLRYAGLAVSIAPSLGNAKRLGSRIGILAVLTQADASLRDPRKFYVGRTSFFQRVKDFHLLTGEPSKGTRTRVVATVALHVTLVDLTTGQVLWRGLIQQSAENIVHIPPLNESHARIEGAAGTGEFEPQAYAIRSLLVQAYVQLGQSLARQIQASAMNKDRQ